MENLPSQPIPAAPATRRFGRWSRIGGGSLTFALLFHAVLLVICGLAFIKLAVPEPPPPDFTTRGGSTGSIDSPKPNVTAVKPTQLVPPSEIGWIVANNPNVKVSIITNDSDGKFSELPTISNNGGSDGSSGQGLLPGPGFNPFDKDSRGVKPAFRFPDQTFGKRCSMADRLNRINANGGTKACEDAVARSLQWLKDHQNSDGSWGSNQKAAMTGLALLAYFGHCETPASMEYGETTNKGIAYLIDLAMKNNGRIATNLSANSWPYEHAIATYALAEATTFCMQIQNPPPNLRETTAKAGQFIIDHQHKNGGWAYLYAQDGGHTDVSVTGWQIQALKACSHTKIDYQDLAKCIRNGLAYINNCQDKKSGGYGYVSPAPGGNLGYHTLTGVGMLCNQMWGKNDSEVRKGAKYLMRNTRFDYNGEACDLYGHYYESQAMMQRGGEDWKKYNEIFRDQLLDNQDADGSWKAPGGGKKARAVAAEYYTANTPEARIYRTSLCTLMLEVYYRFLSTGGGNDHSKP